MGRLVTKATISALLQLLREDGGGLFLRQLHSRPTVACCLLRLLTAVVSPLIVAADSLPAGVGPFTVTYHPIDTEVTTGDANLQLFIQSGRQERP